jgi:hypothetical protein
MPTYLQLRSHVGVLRLASSIVEVMYKLFPRAIDKLGLDRGLFEGPKPKLLLVDDISELTASGYQFSEITPLWPYSLTEKFN